MSVQTANPESTTVNVWTSSRRLGEPRYAVPDFDPFFCTFDCRWNIALANGLQHDLYLIEARHHDQLVGQLPLLLVKSLVFGRHLVSLPYINTAGVLTKDERVATSLIDHAVRLADKLDVQYLELRHERERLHPALLHQLTSKVHMRLALPTSTDILWGEIKAKVRNQVRKGEKTGLSVHWGRLDLLDDFYDVFSRNMRDLGTPVYGRRLFKHILIAFSDCAELCSIRRNGRAMAAALLVHGNRITQVPSASSLRAFNWTNANMFMYWQLLRRSIERGQECFDFGRSTVNSNTFRFKKQWGAQPEPAVWQYYLRKGSIDSLRPDNSRFKVFIRIWSRLPICVTRLIGPPIVRGIP